MPKALPGLTSTSRIRITALGVVLALLAVAAVQLASTAGAEGLTITGIASSRDAAGIDYDRNGNATSTRSNLGDPNVAVGEAPQDGDDSRAFLPFWVTPAMLAAVKDGGTATASVKVWRAENLGARRLVLEAYTADAVGQNDFNKAATELATLMPVAGKLSVDVTGMVAAMPAKAYLVLRLRLDALAPVDGVMSRVVVGMSEAKVAGNRPTLSVAGKAAPQSTTPTTTTPSTPPPTTSPTTTAPEPTPANDRGSASAGTTVGASRYPVPAGAIVVAPSGSDAAAGTEAAPLQTLTRAVAKATSGATVVLRAGSYHESVVIPTNKRLTLQSWPGEAAWLEGSSPVTGWAASGNRWHKDGWTTELDASPTYTRGAADNTAAGWGFVNAGAPMASHPDQIWIDGVAQHQVGSLAEVGPGAFFHDQAANQLWLGSDPTGSSVRASDLVRALMIRSDNSVVRGLGVRRFAPSVPDMGAVTVEHPGVLVENVAITDTSTTALHVGSGTTPNVTLRNLYLARNGMLGMNASNADNLTVDKVLSEGNNTEHFNTSPVSGGAKIGRTRGVVVKDSIFRNNDGPGLWMDESVYDMTIIGNEMRDNSKHGTSLEISAKAVFADNVVTNNAGYGIKINNTSDVVVWNNTFVGNDRSIFLTQDTRLPTTATTAGRDKRQAFPDPTMTWLNGPAVFANNVIADQRSGSCMLCVEDASKQRTAEQIRVTANGNLYSRRSGSPATLFTWSRGASSPTTFSSVAAFRTATGQEAAGQQHDGTTIVDAGGSPTSVLPGVGGALPLPAAIAALTGRLSGVRALGAWVR